MTAMRKLHFYQILSLSVLICVCVFFYAQSLVIPCPDVTWLMHCSHLMLAGKANYFDYFETNPPLILLFNMPAIFLGTLFHLSDIVAFNSWVVGLSCILVFWHAQLLKRLFPEKLTMVLVLSITLAVIYIVLPLAAFGERDVLTFMLVMPYLLLITLRLQNKSITVPARVVVGLISAVGICFKPYFLFLPIFVELYYLVNIKKWYAWMRVETLVMLGFMVFYTTGVLIFEPNYFAKIMPLTKVLYIPVYFRVPLVDMLTSGINIVFVLLFVALGFFYCLHKNRDYFLAILTLAGFSYYCAVIAAGQVWFYHLYPMFASLLFLGMYCCIAYSDLVLFSVGFKRNVPKKKLLMVMIYIVGAYIFVFSIFIYLLVVMFDEYKRVNLPEFAQIGKFIKSHKLQQPYVLVASYSFMQQSLINETDIKATSRFPSLLLGPGLIDLELRAAHADKNKLALQKRAAYFKKQFFDLYMQDIQKRPPSYFILFHQQFFFYNAKNTLVFYPIMKFLLSDRRFAQYFKSFHLVMKTNKFSIYETQKYNNNRTEARAQRSGASA